MECDIQISSVAFVGLASNLPGNGFPCTNCERVLQVQNGLLPVRVARQRRSGETDWLVDLCKGAFKERDKSVDIVIALGLQFKVCCEVQVFFGAREDIESENGDAIRNQSLCVHHIDDWFLESNISDRGHVETVNVMPKVKAIATHISVFNCGDVHCGFVRKDDPVLSHQPLVTSIKHSVQHGLVEEKIPHPLRVQEKNGKSVL